MEQTSSVKLNQAQQQLNQVPYNLGPVLSLMTETVEGGGRIPDPRMIELYVEVPTIIISADHYKLFLEKGIRSPQQIWQLGVNAYEDAILKSRPLYPKEIPLLTGTNQVDKIDENHPFRILIVSTEKPHKRTGLKKANRDNEFGLPFINELNNYGENNLWDIGNVFEMTEGVMADLEDIYTGVAIPVKLRRYENLGYTQEVVTQYMNDAIAKGKLRQPQMRREGKEDDPKIKAWASSLQAAFQMLFMQDNTTGQPIDPRMYARIQQIKAGNFRVLDDPEAQRILYNRFNSHPDYVVDLPNINNPERPYITTEQLRFFLIELGFIKPDYNMNKMGQLLKELLVEANCLTTMATTKGPDLYASNTPGYAEVPSKDGSGRIVDIGLRAMQQSYCNSCKLASFCKRDDELWLRKVAPTDEERQAATGMLIKYMKMAVNNYSLGLKATIIVPKIGRTVGIEWSLLEHKRKPKGLGGALSSLFGRSTV